MSPAGRGLGHRAGALRRALRAHPVGAGVLKLVVALVGGGLVLLGLLALALPGPLTIPPVLLGLYILASEFAWAERWRDRAGVAGRRAWTQARRRPVATAVTSLLGLAGAGMAVWAFQHYELLARGREVAGL